MWTVINEGSETFTQYNFETSMLKWSENDWFESLN